MTMARNINEKKNENKNEKLNAILDMLKEFNRKERNIFEKLEQLRISFLNCNPSKTGWNPFAKFNYFALEDIVPIAEPLCQALGLCAYPDIEFENGRQFAVMYLVDTDKPDSKLKFRINMVDIDNQGQKSMQEIGSVKTYARRYLWLDILDSAEFDDEIDATSGNKSKQDAYEPPRNSAATTRSPQQAKRDDRPAGKVERTKSLGDTVYKEVVAFFGWSKDLSDAEKADVIADAKELLSTSFNITDLKQITPEIADEIRDYIKRTA